ncbi:MAG: hypothetical protein AB7O60_02025 [Variibacter sp.]
MPPDVAFVLLLIVKMAVSACFVATASFVAERAGVVMGAMVASLPISVGPAYVFLAMDHDASFIAASALATLVSNAATTIFTVAYVFVAQRSGTWASFTAALASWCAAWFIFARFSWNLPTAFIVNLVLLAVAITLVSRFRHAAMVVPQRRWYDLPLRAGLVATLVLAVVLVSARFGPTISGVVAAFPVVFTSLILILHPRIGGRANAAVVANAIPGMVGFMLSVVVVIVAAVPIGPPIALSLALVTAVTWNLALLFARQRGLLS